MISVRLLPDCDHRLDQPDRRIERVVKAVPAMLEEDMAAHLAGERRAGLLHLRLDQAVAGLPHQRLAAELGDPVEQRLARLHVGDDGRARLLLEHRLGEDREQLVAPDHAALAVDRANPVAVAVERDSEVELLVGDKPLQVGEVLLDRRIGVVVGEACRRPR